MRQCGFKISSSAVNRRQIVKACFLLRRCPGRLVKRIICLIHPFLVKKAESQIKICLTVIRVRIAKRHPLNCPAEIRLALRKLSAAQQQKSVGSIAADISRIPPECLKIIRIRQISCMTVLFNMESCQIQFFHRHDFFRTSGRRHRIRNLFNFPRLRRIRQ